MKTIITIVSLAFTISVNAQTPKTFEKTAFEEISANRFLAGGNLTDYDMMHADIYVTVASQIKITYESLSAGDGGQGWKNGTTFNLEAGKWNSIKVDLLNAPFDSYDFSDLRYMILEGFVKAEGGSAEGTPLAIANVYFWNSMYEAIDNVESDKVATKRIINGQLVIEKNGKRYNAVGTEF